MANVILHKPQGVLFSSQIGDFAISVDDDAADVVLVASDGTVLYSERLFAVNGLVTVCELALMIEEYMRLNSMVYGEFSLQVYSVDSDLGSDACTIKVLYCDRITPCSNAAVFLKENFLSTLSMRRYAPGSDAFVFMFANQGESINHKVLFRFKIAGDDSVRHGEYAVNDGNEAETTGVVRLDVHVADVVEAAADYADASASDIELLAFTIMCGQRSASFFMDRSLKPLETFFFRNCFNVPDCITLPAVSSAKTDVERSMASVGGRSMFYDQSVTKSYSVETGALTSDEADFIDQLFAARHVEKLESNCADDTEPFIALPVLITDATCEISDGNEKPNSVKFVWRYADNRPLVDMSVSPGIFNNPYNPVYS